MSAPVAVKAAAAMASAIPAGRMGGSAAARANIDAEWHASTPAPANSTAGRGRHAVSTAWARWRAPRTRMTMRARWLGGWPVASPRIGPGAHSSAIP